MRSDCSRRSERPAKSLAARAIAMLARREYSRAEIRGKLVAGADVADAAEVDRVLDELVALGYLSDTRFASAVVAQKSGSHSKRAIGAALRARGVGDEAITCALEGSEIDEGACRRTREGAPGPLPAKPRICVVGDLEAAARSTGRLALPYPGLPSARGAR